MSKKGKKYELDPVWKERYGKDPTYEDIFRYFGQPVPVRKELGEPQFPPKTDCLMYDDRENSTGCMGLMKTFCCYEKCNFYKPRA